MAPAHLGMCLSKVTVLRELDQLVGKILKEWLLAGPLESERGHVELKCRLFAALSDLQAACSSRQPEKRAHGIRPRPSAESIERVSEQRLNRGVYGLARLQLFGQTSE
jgi:hypothetical protein